MKSILKIFNLWLFIALGAAAITFNSCSKDDNKQTVAAEPIVSDSINGVWLNGIRWATRNVAQPGVFAARPEEAGMFYQWNSIIGWSATDPMIGWIPADSIIAPDANIEWDSNFPVGTVWEGVNDPSPEGWRMPTMDELSKLLDKNKISSEWATLKGVAGRVFTDKGTGASLFLPAAGCRYYTNGMIHDAGLYGNYWSSTQEDIYKAYFLNFYSGSMYKSQRYRNNGFSVRCVAE